VKTKTLVMLNVYFVVVHIDTILKVITYAASHNVKKLNVDVDGFVVFKELELPPSIFYCRSLTFLHLRFWWQHSYNTKKMIPKSLNLPLLKTLHLENLSFTTSDNGCVEPFSTYNMLNTLVIMGCRLHKPSAYPILMFLV
jgi:hypothetical protein